MSTRSSFRIVVLLACSAILSVAFANGAAMAPVQHAEVPPAWFSAAQARLAAEEYELSWQPLAGLPGTEEAWQAPNRTQGFRAVFTPSQVLLRPRIEERGDWSWSLEARRWGRPDILEDVISGTLQVDGNRVENARGSLDEWFLNEPRGLEHGFTIPERPEGEGPLVVDLALGGDLLPAFSADGKAVDFRDGAGTQRIRYTELHVKDASGRSLAASFEAVSEGFSGIRIRVDDSGAVYPVEIDPLATSPAWEVEADGADSAFGSSVCTAGDVNGDGISDLIVGAPRYDGGQADEGKIFVFYGSPSGPSSSADWAAEPDQANARLGASVSTAGDVNGDGYGDILAGAPRYMDTLSQQGGAFLWLGGASGLGDPGTPANADWFAFGPHADAFFGIGVAAVGDENGDHYGDIAVGASWYSNPENCEGAVFFFRGSASVPSGSPDWQAESDQALAQMGRAVAGAGDVDGDGFADLLVGAHLYDDGNADEGAAFLWLGGTLAADPDGTPLNADWSAQIDQDDAGFGTAVSTAGDVNGDGYADVIIGAPGYANLDAGEGGAFLYLGSTTGPSAAFDWKAESNQGGAALGTSAFTSGDIDGNGYCDVVMGAPSYDGSTGDEGAAFGWFGGENDLGNDGTPANADWKVYGVQGGEALGCSVASAGDANGDGWADVIVGADGYDGVAGGAAGRARLFLGGPGTLQSSVGWSWATLGGASVACAGDVNGDGYADLLVGDPAWDQNDPWFCPSPPCESAGRLLLFYGSPSGLAGTPDAVIEGIEDMEMLGSPVVAGIGDVNGDGYDDFAASAYNDGTVSGFEDGRVFVYYGSASGPSSTQDWTARGTQAVCGFGDTLSGGGDVNGDGYADLLVGAPYYDELDANLGLACLFLGSATGLDAGGSRGTGRPSNADWLVRGTTGGTGIGSGVSATGDFDADGFSDLVVGADLWDNGENNEGGAFVWYGGLGGPGGDGTPLGADWHAESNQGGAQLGIGVGTAGDVNGDGYADLIVGAHQYDDGQNNEGGAFLWYGGPSGLGDSGTPANADWMYESNQANEKIGTGVGTAGDLNGDGIADLYAASYTYDYYTGLVHVFIGSPSGPSAAPVWSYSGLSFVETTGRTIGTGDVNGDGRADFFLNRAEYAYVFHGGGKMGIPVNPRQRRGDDSGPLDRLNSLEGTGAVRLALVSRSPFGRTDIVFEREIKPLGTPFDGTGTQNTGWIDSTVSGVDLNRRWDSLSEGSAYHWRVRTRYRPSGSPFASAGPWVTQPWDGWGEQDFKEPADSDGDGVVDPRDNCPFVSNPGQTLGSVGDLVWLDADAGGVQDAGETGISGINVYLYDDAYAFLASTVTDASGVYLFDGLCPGNYHLFFDPPPLYIFTAANQGGDDALDSDADAATGEADCTLGDGEILAEIDCGLLAGCAGPDEPVWIYEVTLSVPEGYPILHFQDPNQPADVTGYHIRRTDDPGLPKDSWPLVATNVVDMDAGTPNIQWTDTSGDGGDWYYQVTAYHSVCDVEGPF